MPFANIAVVEGVFSPAEKQQLMTRVAEALISTGGSVNPKATRLSTHPLEAAMACCQNVDEALGKAISEHNALMKRLGEKQPCGK